MKTLLIDLETYSEAELAKTGVYRYATDQTFEIMLLAYSIDNGEVKCVDLTKEELPQQIRNAILDPAVTKIAHNAQFERVCLTQYLKTRLEPREWVCTMVWASELGLPRSLDYLSNYLKLAEVKDRTGKALITRFAKPYRGKRVRAIDEPDLWQKFIDYCIQDVKTEVAVYKRLFRQWLPKEEWELYALDQDINDRGIGVDVELAKTAIEIDTTNRQKIRAKLENITGLANPNSIQQMSEWVRDKGVKLPNLLKGTVEEAVNSDRLPLEVKQALSLRLAMSNTSTKKYEAMIKSETDGRIHGILQFYGAARTGRWAGRIVQVQNLPRGNADSALRKRLGDKDKTLTSEELKSLIRTALIAKQGCEFVVSDFSAIEARVLAWLADEQWALEAFAAGEDIYKATAASMYHTTVDKVDKEMRSRGKIATLALGYQGSVGALTRMGAEDMGITKDEQYNIMTSWRKANNNIVRFWAKVEAAAKRAIMTKSTVSVDAVNFTFDGETMFIQLPSGRSLAYQRAKIKDGSITYQEKTTGVAFETVETYGGKLTENIVQAVARDVLANAMINIDCMGYDIVAHIHDEVLVEAPKGTLTVEELNDLMTIGPKWADGLPLNAEGFISEYYKKG